MAERTGTPQDWIDRAFNNVVGMAAGQESYAPILSPLADLETGVSYPQLRCRELAGHLFSSGHVSYDEIGWADKVDDTYWLSSSMTQKSNVQAHVDYSLMEMVDPTEIIGGEHVVGILSVVPWVLHEEWLADIDMSAYFPEVGQERVKADLRASRLLAKCAHRPIARP